MALRHSLEEGTEQIMRHWHAVGNVCVGALKTLAREDPSGEAV